MSVWHFKEIFAPEDPPEDRFWREREQLEELAYQIADEEDAPELTLDHVYRAADELGLRWNEDMRRARDCLPDDFEEEVWEGIRDDYASDHEVA